MKGSRLSLAMFYCVYHFSIKIECILSDFVFYAFIYKDKITQKNDYAIKLIVLTL